ncbi:MAG: hypothetical protein HZB91_01810, partial [Elusimicrobia bacterium]|nr:hypothetical protein [Elusimicrobiota bacterium]
TTPPWFTAATRSWCVVFAARPVNHNEVPVTDRAAFKVAKPSVDA